KEKEESSEDDDDEEEEGASEEDEDEEEHLALADSAAATPPPPPPRSPQTKSLFLRYFASAPTPSSPPPSLLPHWSSLLPQIPSPLLPVLSPPLPLPSPPTYTSVTYADAPLGYRATIIRLRATSPPPPIPSPPLHVLSPHLPLPSPPTHTSPTYVDVPLGYKAAMIQSRATSPPPVPSPPLLLPDHRSDIPETDMSFQKRLCLTTPASRFEVGESSIAAATRQTGHTLARRVDYRFVDTDDRALLRAHISLLTRERRYFRSMASSYEREAVIARQAWSRLEDKSTALEASIRTLKAQVRTLQTQHDRMEWQRQHAGDMVTSAFRRIRALEARDRARLDDLEDTGSSC
ncbi:hypothetical protein Tco_1065916, partial [Tanacetum coccineum]